MLVGYEIHLFPWGDFHVACVRVRLHAPGARAACTLVNATDPGPRISCLRIPCKRAAIPAARTVPKGVADGQLVTVNSVALR